LGVTQARGTPPELRVLRDFRPEEHQHRGDLSQALHAGQATDRNDSVSSPQSGALVRRHVQPAGQSEEDDAEAEAQRRVRGHVGGRAPA